MTFMGLPKHQIIISNKEELKPANKIAMKKWTWQNGWGDGYGTDTGYSFSQYLCDCYYLLGDDSKINGMQQLIHHYYLQCICDAETAVKRIRKFLGIS